MHQAFNTLPIQVGGGCYTPAAYQYFRTVAVVSLLREMMLCRLAPALATRRCRYGAAQNACKTSLAHIRRCRYIAWRMTIGLVARRCSCAIPVERLTGCLVLGASAGSKSVLAVDLHQVALLRLQKIFAKRASLATRSSFRSRRPRYLT